MKQFLFERIDLELAPTRAESERLIANPREVEQHLKRGRRESARREPALSCRDPRASWDSSVRALSGEL